MLQLEELKRAIWEGYELKVRDSGKLKAVDEVVKAKMLTRKIWMYRYPKEHRCFFKWTKRCPEFCNFEKPCEELVEDSGEEESLTYGFLVKAGNDCYFAESFEVDVKKKLLIFHPRIKLKNGEMLYCEKVQNRFGFLEVATEILTYERIFGESL